MVEDLRSRANELKKRFEDDEPIKSQSLTKVDKITEVRKIHVFTENLFEELKKSSPEARYLHTVVESCEELEPHQIRYIVELSHDRYDSLLKLMNKYNENFDTHEFEKYNVKYTVLDKVLSFMISEHLGEYLNAEDE
jgi:predicted RNase H-like nuclease